MRPRTASAGQETHQPTESTDSPWSETMFQSAGTLRQLLVKGTPSGSLRKSVIPWASIGWPVATVVQITGE